MERKALKTPVVAKIAGISQRRLLALVDQGLVCATIQEAQGPGTRRLWSSMDVLRVVILTQLASLFTVSTLRLLVCFLTDENLKDYDFLIMYQTHLDNPVVVAPVFSMTEDPQDQAQLAEGEAIPLKLSINLRELRAWVERRLDA